MIRTGDDTNPSSSCYTLFLEYLGGLVPLLKGRRVSKLRPEFVIYDPKVSLEQKQGTFVLNYSVETASMFTHKAIIP